ncbi:NAD-binding Rossmann fold oxidoreductase family protein [Verticillium alfalfae VaMs.102]|uniref:NAD-binding Rossmann fold oxidoreductase family protein n=1 Tax=Verticillium alfalfae (strain VaMs.102 / ATCC MYA-4576 / FGSC 10136) TaxID=526221 RepID=C9SS31_VERA1|nr:NAD-binding Rossmann fold oxidoreductase family protein [Verticillium alfalfae VaMs.102]EEY21596.1 NAD-binding Rossmann fold oxidoreductase family protein [Verticillium alfalfae VaMs.102]
MIGIALLGAGLFAQEQHLPAIQSSKTFELRAVYSRSLKSASALAANTSSPDAVTTYADDHPTPSRSLADILARTDVSAVIICLPIPAQPGAIRLALAAGKHVLSEKPIAPSVADARALVSWHQSLARAPVWPVAETTLPTAAAASTVTSTAAAAPAAAITTVAVPVVASIASIACKNVTACVMTVPPSVSTARLTAPVA